MIHRRSGDIVFECDTCERELETNTDEFPVAQLIFKRDGWKAEKVGKDWVHGCANCGT